MSLWCCMSVLRVNVKWKPHVNPITPSQNRAYGSTAKKRDSTP